MDRLIIILLLFRRIPVIKHVFELVVYFEIFLFISSFFTSGTRCFLAFRFRNIKLLEVGIPFFFLFYFVPIVNFILCSSFFIIIVILLAFFCNSCLAHFFSRLHIIISFFKIILLFLSVDLLLRLGRFFLGSFFFWSFS